jgi:hypothetical protein
MLLFVITLICLFIKQIVIDRRSPLRDFSQITSDGKYEYNLEIINFFTILNNRSVLHIIEISTGIEIRIYLPLPSNAFNSNLLGDFWSLISMKPTAIAEIYIVSTTMMFNLEQRWSYEINVVTGDVHLIEHIEFKY